MPKVDDPGKYLGIPTIWGRSKRDTLAYMKDRVMAKVTGWKRRFLSQAGKEVFIKAVAQAIVMYPMCVFRFPDKLCNEINAMVAQFWWVRADKDRGINWISWVDMGRPKRDCGIGFRNPKDFNVALLAKQRWRLIHNPDSLWARVLKERYFPNVSFLDARKRGIASWAWNSLLEGKDLILKGVRWQILGGHVSDFELISGSWISLRGTPPFPLIRMLTRR
ncbi:uncharacterized mitochondrial protein AtMg00310-like [Pyrus communis]|uniref:uncharacterized mitochondrial protein AtMg00310-like n=1 Tax=Pyrus communis TaxID=23211 RepID=UPI0035C01BFC